MACLNDFSKIFIRLDIEQFYDFSEVGQDLGLLWIEGWVVSPGLDITATKKIQVFF